MNHEVASQEDVLAFLADPATHGGDDVRRIDTHAASVFLAGSRVLKIKRAVQYCFLDFSTLEKRKAACEAELGVNRRLAPMIYRRVLPITRESNGKLALDGRGKPVEWAIEMRRFDENLTFDHLARSGRIDAPLADALGRVIAASHADGMSFPALVAPEEWIEAVGRYIEEQAAGFAEWPNLFARAEVECLARTSLATHARVRPLLARRGEKGLIRRIHGDLHLANIVLLEGRPVLFDAIEFSPLIASGDVLYDLAFPLMDLMNSDLTVCANVVFNRYLAKTRRPDDIEALAALPLFLSVRTQIRANVSAARLAFTPAAQHDSISNMARSYFALAQKLIAPPAPMLIAIGGLSGTGKTALARALAADIGAAPGALVLRSDVERKALLGRAETERLPGSAYAAETTSKVYAMLCEKAQRALAAGHAVIADAVFVREQERTDIEAVARALGMPFAGIFLRADLSTRMERLGARRNDASDADAVIARQQEGYDIGRMHWTMVDASGSEAATLARAKAAISA